MSRFTGEELLRARGRDQTLPTPGEKLEEAGGSWLEAQQVEARRHLHQDLLTEPKVNRKDQVARGEWLQQSRMVHLTHKSGKFWQYMGVEADIGPCLYPEEALYLIDTGELEVVWGGVVVSVQQAQTLFLDHSHHLQCYRVYAHLSRAGCKVVKHQTHLVYSNYEKQIRLDQHQVNRKGEKLKLKAKEPEPVTAEPVEDKNETYDVEMQELYASLGETAENPNKTEETVVSSKKSVQNTSPSNQPPVSSNEQKRKELLDMFPNFSGCEGKFTIRVQPAHLLPKNSVPHKKVYELSRQALSYYSIYFDGPREDQQSHQNWGRGREKRARAGNRYSQNSWRRQEEESWRDQQEYGVSWRGQERGAQSHWRGNSDREDEGRWQWERNSNRRGNDAASYYCHDVERWREDDRQHQHQEKLPGDVGGRWDEMWRDGSQRFQERGSQGPGSRQNSGGGGGERHIREQEVNYTQQPHWKRKNRKRQRQQGFDRYPSCLVKLHTKVSSWKEYKQLVKEKQSAKLLTSGVGGCLWRGRITPLLNPTSASSKDAALSAVSLVSGSVDCSTFSQCLPQHLRLTVHYDVYLPTVPYKKSSPTQPSKRVTVMRGGEMPSPGQILEVTSRFQDEVPVVSAVEECGEVRLYALTPLHLPQPLTTR